MEWTIETDQGPGKRARVERLQIIDALADADKLDRRVGRLSDGHQHAPPGSAVELGHDYPGNTDGVSEDILLRQRVPSDGRVKNEEHLVWGLRIDLT